MVKTDMYDKKIRVVIEKAMDEIRLILDQKLQAEFESFVAGRSTGKVASSPGPKLKGTATKKAAPKKRRKTKGKRVRVAEVAAAALAYLSEASGPVSINEVSEATGYPLEKLRRGLGVLHAGKKISKSGNARATRYAIGGGGKPKKEVAKKKAAPKKKVARKKKAAPKKKTPAKK